MAKILVTGGTGYIGSHTVVELQQSGYEVVIVDNLSNSSEKIVDQITKITGIKPRFHKFDLCDREALQKFWDEHTDIEGVIHFAAYKAVGESVQFPLKYYHNNLVSLTNLLEIMEQRSCKKLVFSSSCTVYGQPAELPVSENAPIQKANSPYGNTKQIAEEIIFDHAYVSSLKAIALRYFNPIGSHESALIGELPIGVPNNLVPFITQTAIGKRDSLKVWGDDYDTPDGTAIRDYIHVVDLAKAHVVAMERMDKTIADEKFEVFNLGTGRGNSVLDVILTFEQANGIKLNYQIAQRREGDVEKVWADTRKANEVLGWKTQLGLETALKSAWAWEKNLAEGIVD
ncbi:MAG: UDP-glucose 4-epimerase GalE [Bacteroidetes bacterium]|nr:MAG: UDP-glucose 4-epimerase GalE [Bacteroidota bacterium]